MIKELTSLIATYTGRNYVIRQYNPKPLPKGQRPKCKTCAYYKRNFGCAKKFHYPAPMDMACEQYERRKK